MNFVKWGSRVSNNLRIIGLIDWCWYLSAISNIFISNLIVFENQPVLLQSASILLSSAPLSKLKLSKFLFANTTAESAALLPSTFLGACWEMFQPSVTPDRTNCRK
ncbi:hypothetical protein GOODEAATRI_001226 [Goodea atripinnis]|uniref:Uncharacterized protein n=1 Tax=Goodea atripinnis TaxID=208336 RepID=A0ABV0PUB3_9TELE